MGRDDSDATQVKRNQWRQGSVAPSALIETLVDNQFLPWELAEGQLLVVISHDCDVMNPDFNTEPNVEFLRATLLRQSKKRGDYFWGKNPRKYQIEDSSTGASLIWQFAIHDRACVPRHFLLDVTPDHNRSLAPDNLKRLCRWLARRYSRQAFPDAFNERTQDAIQRLRKKLKSQGDLLTAIYLAVCDEELSPHEPYDIIMYGSMRVEDFAIPEKRSRAQQVLDKVEAALGGCDGIDIKVSELKSEADISLDDLRKLKRWDFDYLTVRGADVADLPPEE